MRFIILTISNFIGGALFPISVFTNSSFLYHASLVFFIIGLAANPFNFIVLISPTTIIASLLAYFAFDQLWYNSVLWGYSAQAVLYVFGDFTQVYNRIRSSLERWNHVNGG